MKTWRLRLAAAVLLLALGLAACGNGSTRPEKAEVAGEITYNDAQAMVIIATERNRYRDIYTDRIFDVKVDEQGTEFRDYLIGEIRNFMTELRTMNLLADEKGLKLSGQEKERLRELAAQYYEGLTDADRAYIGVGEEDIFELYQQYYRANRLVDELTGEVNLEISDSEAKVIGVQEIVLTDAAKALLAYEQISAENADFAAAARSLSVDPEIEKKVGRGERSAKYEDEVFRLENGQISPIITADGKYYIVKVVNEYDEAATLERKQKLALQRKNSAFRMIYDTFAGEHPVELAGDIWDGAVLGKGEESVTTDFFTRYREFMNQ